MTRTPFRSLVAGLILVLVVAAPALAADQTTVATESFTVQSTTTLTGVPASLAYGSGLGGQTLSAPQFTAAASTNAPNGVKLVVTGSVPPPNVSRSFAVGVYLCNGLSVSATTKTGNGPHEFCPAIGTSMGINLPITPSLIIGATAVPGTYTSSTLTVSAVEK